MSQIDDPKNAAWLKQQFTRQKSIDLGINEQITQGELQLAFIEYSLRLDQALAVAGDMVPEYEGTLASELVELRCVADLLRTKAAFISGKHEDLVVEPALTGMLSMIESYQQLLPDKFQPKTIAASNQPADQVVDESTESTDG